MWIVQDLVPLGVGPSLATVVLNRTNLGNTVKGNLENIAAGDGAERPCISKGGSGRAEASGKLDVERHRRTEQDESQQDDDAHENLHGRRRGQKTEAGGNR